MKNNPFSLDFGAEPNLCINRYEEYNRIINAFMADKPSTHIFMLIGARGTGKTVLMTMVSHKLCEEKDWIHIDLSSERDMLHSLAASLYENSKKKKISTKLELTVGAAKVTLEKNKEYSDIQIDLDNMLCEYKKKNIRVIITLDEAANSKNIREFTTYFQHCLREGFQIFVLMTGLYKNLRALENNRTQTFLKRAPRINIGPLNNMRIGNAYKEVFNINDAEASFMAKQTCGYSYGFQMLGYLVFESKNQKMNDEIIQEYKTMLGEFSYEKIWEELSAGERKIVAAIASAENEISVKDVREMIEMDSNNFSTYKSSLEKGGILQKDSAYGMVDFALPYFRDFINSTVTII